MVDRRIVRRLVRRTTPAPLAGVKGLPARASTSLLTRLTGDQQSTVSPTATKNPIAITQTFTLIFIIAPPK
jgi:hypothetical protein